MTTWEDFARPMSVGAIFLSPGSLRRVSYDEKLGIINCRCDTVISMTQSDPHGGGSARKMSGK